MIKTQSVSATTRRVQPEAIDAVAQQIVEEFRPERIILFGSYAYGEPDADSDVDLMVVMDTPLREVDQAVAIGRRLRYRFGLDLIVRTPSNLEHRIAMGDWFLREIVARGKVIYERADSGMGGQG